MNNKLRDFGGEVIRLFCSLAILLLAITHTVSTSNAAQIEIAAYALPNGSVLDFCLNSGTAFGDSENNTQCELCRVAGAFVLPNTISVIKPIAFNSLEISGSEFQFSDANSIVLSARSLRGPPN